MHFSTIQRLFAVRLVNLPAVAKATMAMTVDFVALLGAAALALVILPNTGHIAVADAPLWLLAAIAMLLGLYITQAYRMITRYAGMALLWTLTRGLVVGLGLLVLFLAVLWDHGQPWRYHLVFSSLAFAMLLATRVAASAWLRPNSAEQCNKNRVLIYGAGEAGVQLGLALNMGERYQHVGFIDDRRDKQQRTLMGLPIYSPATLPALKRADVFDQILLAIPSLSRTRRKAILDGLDALAVPVKIMPSLDELTAKGSLINELRPVQIEDLLSRDPVVPNQQLMDAFIRDKIVMITGAGGSIGSELARTVLKCGVRKLVLLDISEHTLYEIERNLRDQINGATPPPVIVPVLNNVLDREAVATTIREHGVHTVYHAAAYKHVPMVEANAMVGIRNNVIGTLNVLQAAAEHGVKHFVHVSTDKAVRPTSIMGASKRVAELIVQAQAGRSPQMQMAIVRFGNVLASSGSVVPLFQKQLAKGGPITVTSPEVTRYFMTIREAAQLVIQAGAMGQHGEIFLLEMGQPVRILDLACRCIRLSGLQVKDQDNPDGDIEIVFTGLRPGEKLYEELLIDATAIATSHPRIHKAIDGIMPGAMRDHALHKLVKSILSDNRDVHTIVELMHNLISGMNRPNPLKIASTQSHDAISADSS